MMTFSFGKQVLHNIDHLFSLRLCDFAFAPDLGVDVSAARLYSINSGVFVHAPHHTILDSMLAHREAYSSLNSEGGFLAAFINANRDRIDERISICDLDPSYNTKRQLFLSHPPLWNCMKPYVMVLHFTGRTKPWHVRVPSPPRSKSKKGHSPSPPEEGRGEGGDIPFPSSAPLSSDPLFALWWAIYENSARSLALSDADVRQLPYIGAALAAAALWMLVVCLASCRFSLRHYSASRAAAAEESDRDDEEHVRRAHARKKHSKA
ncbi:MAG: hypothetical protein SGPRY_012116, partial [Prymnesium sp.]